MKGLRRKLWNLYVLNLLLQSLQCWSALHPIRLQLGADGEVQSLDTPWINPNLQDLKRGLDYCCKANQGARGFSRDKSLEFVVWSVAVYQSLSERGHHVNKLFYIGGSCVQ